MSDDGLTVFLPCGCKASAAPNGIAGQPVCQPHQQDPAQLGFAIAALPAATKALLAQTASTASDPTGTDSTYTNDPKNNPIDAVRLRLRDTKAPFQFTDAEIQYMLDDNGGNPLRAALEGCINLQSRFAGMAAESVGSVSYSFGNNAQSYAGLAAQLRRQLAVFAAPYCGGISRFDKWRQAQDFTKTQPFFTRHMLQNDLRRYGGMDRYYYDYDILCL